MVYIKKDTKRLTEYIKKMNDNISKCNVELDALFQKFNSIKDYWVGEDANLFLMQIKKEQKIYIDYISSITNYTNSLIKMNTELETTIASIKKVEQVKL